VLWSLTMLAVLGRLALSLRENTRLLEMVRTDQLTGLGSQARLRMDLDAGAPAGAERPLTLILLDLNGFKHYNDTFGHPAGDKMLGLLGGRLRGAVAPEGVGYRLGGDEFVVLVEGRVPNREAVAVRAAEALTSSGSGFDLSAAWGIASVPEEADSAAAAMQLADVRMYAQKESRRLAGPLSALDREALEQSQ
jgi:two-component system, cell cycle response regulator